MPLFDSYNDYVAISTFIESGKVIELNPWPGSHINPKHPSRWPLEPIFTIFFSLINKMDIVQSSIIISSTYGLIMLLFIGLLTKILSNETKYGDKIWLFSLLFFAVSPDGIYDRMAYYHRFFGQAIFFMSLYLIAKRYRLENKIRASSILLILISVAIVISHSIVSYTHFQIISYLAYLPLIIKLLQKRDQEKYSQLPIPLKMPLISLVSIFIWMIVVTPYSLYQIINFVTKIVSPIPDTMEIELGAFSYQAREIPEVISSTTMKIMLITRDAILYLPALIGALMFIVTLRVKDVKDSKNLFLLCSLIGYSGIFIIVHIGGRQSLIFITSYGMPIIAFFAAFFFTYIYNKNSVKIVKILLSMMIIFTVVMAFLAPWSHRYFGNFLYDPSIRPEDVGMHNPTSLYMKPFIDNYVTYEDKKVLSDAYVHSLYIILQPKDYSSIDRRLEFLGQHDTYVFETINMNPRFASGVRMPEDVVEFSYNKVLNAFHYSIHYKDH